MRYPTREEEQELIRRFREGDGEAREHLILCNLSYIRGIARVFQNRGLSIDDLEQIGTVGFIESLNRHDPKRGTRVRTFSSWWVKGRILDAIARRSLVVGPRKGYTPTDPRAKGTASLEFMQEKAVQFEDEAYDPAIKVAQDNELQDCVRGALEYLAPRTRKIVKMRFGIDRKDEMTMVDIGRELGISSERVRQILGKAMVDIRRRLPRDRL